ncbi:MAG TPA: hypothetical protein VL171_16425 [Verrucomicrobiae bacterium]|nr:hypothetical protein [Verrucomicrobiae bacterium]
MMPTISDFSVRLFLLFFPGLLCTYIVDALTVHKPRQPLFFILQAFVSGLSAYLIYWLLHGLYQNWFVNTGFHSYLHGVVAYWFPNAGPLVPARVVFLDALRSPNIRIAYREIVWTCFVAIGLGLVSTLFSTYKIPYRIVRKCWISKKIGELDIWGYAFNIPAPEAQWATVRDLANDLVYDGWVQAFSDDSEHAELYLREVDVFRNSTGELLYKTGAIYLALNKECISIEFRAIQQANDTRNKEEQHGETTPEIRRRTKDSEGIARGNGEEGGSQSTATDNTTTTSAAGAETCTSSTVATATAGRAEEVR